jgi:hypothetical protein
MSLSHKIKLKIRNSHKDISLVIASEEISIHKKYNKILNKIRILKQNNNKNLIKIKLYYKVIIKIPINWHTIIPI